MKTVLGALINRRRKELGLTQKELGEMLNISGQAVSGWEIDGKYPDIMTLPALRRILSLTEEEILKAIEGVETEVKTWTDSEQDNATADDHEQNAGLTVQTVSADITDRALRECLYTPGTRPVCITDPLRDSIAYSLRRSEIYLIAGYDATVSKQILLNATNNVLKNQHGKVYFFTMGELGKDIIKQLIGIEAKVSTRFYMVDQYTEAEKERLTQAGAFYRNASLYIDEQRYLSIEDMFRKCTSVQENLDLIVINGVKTLTSVSVLENRAEARYNRNRNLHGIAIDCRCPVMITSDMCENDHDGIGIVPEIEDVQDKELAESANHVWLIDRQDRYRYPAEWDHSVKVRVVKERYRTVFERSDSKLNVVSSNEEPHHIPYFVILNYDEITGNLNADSITGID